MKRLILLVVLMLFSTTAMAHPCKHHYPLARKPCPPCPPVTVTAPITVMTPPAQVILRSEGVKQEALWARPWLWAGIGVVAGMVIQHNCQDDVQITIGMTPCGKDYHWKPPTGRPHGKCK